MGGIPSGLAEGTTSSFGEFDECLDIQSPASNSDGSIIYGQYCLAKVILPTPKEPFEEINTDTIRFHNSNINQLLKELKSKANVNKLVVGLNFFEISLFRIGLCMPSACNANDVELALNKSKSWGIKLCFEIISNEGFCFIFPLNHSFISNHKDSH